MPGGSAVSTSLRQLGRSKRPSQEPNGKVKTVSAALIDFTRSTHTSGPEARSSLPMIANVSEGGEPAQLASHCQAAVKGKSGSRSPIEGPSVKAKTRRVGLNSHMRVPAVA